MTITRYLYCLTLATFLLGCTAQPEPDPDTSGSNSSNEPPPTITSSSSADNSSLGDSSVSNSSVDNSSVDNSSADVIASSAGSISSSISSSASSAQAYSITTQANEYVAQWSPTDSIRATDDNNSQPGLSGFTTGSWLEYNIELEYAGTYALTLNYALDYALAQADPDTRISLIVNGQNRLANAKLDDQNSAPFDLGALKAGENFLRLYVANLDNTEWRLADLTLTATALGDTPTNNSGFAPGNATTGEMIYGQQCAGCHGENGEGNSLINAPAVIDCGTCGTFQSLAIYIAESMPTSVPANCDGQCAADVAAFIIEAFNQDFDLASCDTNEPIVSDTPLKRLGQGELILTLTDLLAIPDGADFSLIPSDPRYHNFNTLGEKQVVSTSYLNGVLEIVNREAQAVLDNNARRQQVIGCNTEAAECFDEFITNFGLLAFRRPITGIERGRIKQFVETFSINNDDKFVLAIQTLLASPEFLYRLEIGGDWTKCAEEDERCEFTGWRKVRYGNAQEQKYVTKVVDNGVNCTNARFGDPRPGKPKACYIAPTRGTQALDAYELASRLSFSLLGRAPDSALLAKAANGDLDTDNGLQEAAQKLLEDPRANRHFLEFFEQWLALYKLDDSLNPQDKPARWYDNALNDMRMETHNLLAEYAWQDKDFLGVLTANHSYITPELANYYGVAAPASGKIEFSPGDPRAHSGLLTHGANMFAKTDGDLISIRGTWLREAFLCEAIEIPASALQAINGKFAGLGGLEIITARNEDPSCKGCHAIIDPVGVALSGFDGEGGFDLSQNVGEFPIGPGFPDAGGGSIMNAKHLAQKLATMDKVSECLNERLFYFTQFKEPKGPDACAINKANQAFKNSGNRFQAALLALLEDEAFKYRRVPDPTP